MPESASESYDRVHYPAKPYHVARPDHLETLGLLFGMRPAPATGARVLEIGCGTGANLLLAADCFPGASFLGIDVSPSQIEAGNRMRATTGAKNVELRVFDLTAIDEAFGDFDYIVAHGVYSWVPAPVRETLLEVVRARLSPHGIAYLSHNVKPGWNAKDLAGGIMRYRTRGLRDPAERVSMARAFLERVLAHASPGDRLYRATIAERLEAALERDADVLYHDELSEVCDGSWFWEVAERLEAHGLQFLADAETEMLGPTGLGEEALREMAALSTNVIELEQHLDFLRNRAFRMTLACHATVAVKRVLSPERLDGMHVGIDPGVTEIAAASPSAPLTITTSSTRMTVEDPLVKRILGTLGGVWPGSLSMGELAKLGAGVGPRVLDLFRGGFVSLSPRTPTFTLAPPERPRGCALARLQAQSSAHVVNLRHTHSALDEDARKVLKILDGTRDRAALRGELGLDEAALEAALERLARLALICAA